MARRNTLVKSFQDESDEVHDDAISVAFGQIAGLFGNVAVVQAGRMVSQLHEVLIQLFRNRSEAAIELLRTLRVQLPHHDQLRLESSDLGSVQPAEFRADLVLVLLNRSDKVLGVIVEVQLSRDEDKPYAWPAYIANLRARHRCPVCLLVITDDTRVARWAGRPIELGPGSYCMPWVVGPSNMPAITDAQEAERNVELAVLSAVEHGRDKDTELAVRVASAAISACAHVAAESSRLYSDVIRSTLSNRAAKEFEVVMNSFKYEYQSEFARRHFGEGKASIVLEQLTSRFGTLSEADRTRVGDAHEKVLSAVGLRILTAQTLEEALSPLNA